MARISETGVQRHPSYHHNPFITELEINYVRKTIGLSKNQNLISEDGELSENIARMVISKNVDSESFLKIFHSQMPWRLSPRAIYVFLFMISFLKMNRTIMYFNPLEVIKEKKYGMRYNHSPPLYKGLDELIEMKFIAKSLKKHCYWINPKYAYNGSRMNIKEMAKNSINGKT